MDISREVRFGETPIPDGSKQLAADHIDRQIAGAYRSPFKYFDTPPEVIELTNNRLSAVDRLRDWFSGRAFRVEQKEDIDLRIPLFVLAAANVAGCTASITTEQEALGALKWGVTVFGTGLGASAQLTVTSSSKFTSTSGEIKVVFLPASVTIEKGTMLKDGRSIGEGYRVDAAKLRTTGAPGLLLLATGKSPPIGEFAEKYPLSGDTSGAVATYEYAYTHSRSGDLSLGLKAYGIDLSLKATVTLSRSVTLTYGLVSGFDYELHRLEEGNCLVWEQPSPSEAPSA
ncbi:MAG: hypothetical protein ACXVRS_14695 [Gaiellaceae bacterium]